MNTIVKGIEDDLSVNQIAGRIANSFANPNEILSRAKTIARTEMLTAVSIGQNAAVENAKEVIPGLKKAWITAEDERVRDSHRMVGEQAPIDVDDVFANELRFPRDPEVNMPEETINCRCTLILITPEEQ